MGLDLGGMANAYKGYQKWQDEETGRVQLDKDRKRKEVVDGQNDEMHKVRMEQVGYQTNSLKRADDLATRTEGVYLDQERRRADAKKAQEAGAIPASTEKLDLSATNYNPELEPFAVTSGATAAAPLPEKTPVSPKIASATPANAPAAPQAKDPFADSLREIDDEIEVTRAKRLPTLDLSAKRQAVIEQKNLFDSAMKLKGMDEKQIYDDIAPYFNQIQGVDGNISIDPKGKIVWKSYDGSKPARTLDRATLETGWLALQSIGRGNVESGLKTLGGLNAAEQQKVIQAHAANANSAVNLANIQRLQAQTNQANAAASASSQRAVGGPTMKDLDDFDKSTYEAAMAMYGAPKDEPDPTIRSNAMSAVREAAAFASSIGRLNIGSGNFISPAESLEAAQLQKDRKNWRIQATEDGKYFGSVLVNGKPILIRQVSEKEASPKQDEAPAGASQGNQGNKAMPPSFGSKVLNYVGGMMVGNPAGRTGM